MLFKEHTGLTKISPIFANVQNLIYPFVSIYFGRRYYFLAL